MSGEGEERRAFVVARSAGETWVHPLPSDGAIQRGGSDPAVEIVLDGAPKAAFELTWDGTTLSLASRSSGVFLQGKRFEGTAELKPGDEIAVGAAQLVVGVSMPLTAGGRRALTHHEFRERLYEEMSRAYRSRRPTALVMVSSRTGEGGRVAAAALETLRGGDVVATYASDEPELLLPDTDFATAHAVIARMLAHAELEASVGIAVAPDHGDSPERLLKAARAALEVATEKGGIQTPPEPAVSAAVDLTAHDPATVEVASLLEDAAADQAPVLLVGEKASGKSVFARLLHERAGGAGKPYEVIRCTTLASSPTEEELNRATGGTLLFDEIGDLRSEYQEVVLRWLETEPDVRLIATTHRALAGLVERGAFDRGLHEIFAARVIEIPALRNRPEDIIPLAARFASRKGSVRMSPGALARLRSYPWPGNVLELRNAIERAVRLARDGEILAEHLPSEPMLLATTGGNNEGRLREHVDSVERDAIIKALADCNHNQTHAAKRLGISRRALIYKMEKYGLKRPPKGSRAPRSPSK
ncbi:MAG: sigma 54-interacting transcriptional regulator [Myxococcota bacterium]